MSKKSKSRKSKGVGFLQIIILSFVIVAVLSLMVNVTQMLISRAEVLGESTLIAQGRSQEARGQSGERQSGKPEEVRAAQEERLLQRGNTNKLSEKSVIDPVRELTNTATDGGNVRHRGAIIHHPHTIDPTTNTMYITTPSGTKSVVLPAKAIQNMLTRGILSKIGGRIASPSGDLGGATQSAEIVSIESEEDVAGDVVEEDIALEEENGKFVYKIKGSIKQKFLGFIPVDLERNVTVLAEDGEVESIQQSPFTQLLDLFSF